MCGINGILHFNQSSVDENQLIKMRDILQHRGPDGAGIFINENIGLGHRRLSIIDTTSAAQQPFYSENERYILVFNGEIYNYQSFYTELKSKGMVLRTSSDTEVLLKMYELYGLDMLSRLNGMFAFAIWDKQEKNLTLVRDRMGVKPLYYTIYKQSIYFASEQKALFVAGIPIAICENGLHEYFYNRFVAGEQTLYQNIFKVVPGHAMIVSNEGEIKTIKWWDLKQEIQNHPKILNPTAWFEQTFYESVKLRMVSDVPVGILLSGGLDSSSILSSLYHQNYKDINTFNIGFSEEKHNESFLAERLTSQYNYNFNSLKIEGDFLFDNLEQATYNQDEPLMHMNEPHLYAISKLANTKVKVLLSGEGADELMGGYVRYKALKNPTLLKAISHLSQFESLAKNPRFNKLIRYSTIKTEEDLIIYNGSSIYPNDITQFYGDSKKPENKYRYKILKEAQELYPNNVQRQALFFDQHTYLCSLLDRNDRCTMGASIECREPFLDQRLITGLGTLKNDMLFYGKKGKFILKTVMENKLPQEILNFRKIGLSSPWENYLVSSKKFKDEMQSFAKSEIFNFPFLANLNGGKLVQEVEKGNKQIIPYILPLFMLHIWQKKYFQKFV